MHSSFWIQWFDYSWFVIIVNLYRHVSSELYTTICFNLLRPLQYYLVNSCLHNLTITFVSCLYLPSVFRIDNVCSFFSKYYQSSLLHTFLRIFQPFSIYLFCKVTIFELWNKIWHKLPFKRVYLFHSSYNGNEELFPNIRLEMLALKCITQNV